MNKNSRCYQVGETVHNDVRDHGVSERDGQLGRGQLHR